MSIYISTIAFFREEYTILFFILFLLAFFSCFNKNKHINNSATIFISIVYGLVVGLRDINVGADTVSYHNIFIENKIIPGDVFFSIFTKFTHYFLTSPSAFITLLSLIFYMLLGLFCIKKSNSLGNSLILFFGFISVVYMYEVATNVIRQGISIVIVLFSLLYLKNNKVKYFLVLLLSMLIHLSSALFAITTLIAIKIKIKIVILLYIITLILYTFNISLVSISNIIFNYIPMIKNIDPRIAFWASGDALGYYRIIKSGISGYIIINTFFMISYYFMQRKYPLLFENNFIIKLFILLSSFLVLSTDFPFPDRIGVLSWFLIPLIFEPMLRKSIKTKFAYVLFMAIFFFLWALIRSYYQI